MALLTYQTDVKRRYDIRFLGESGGERVASEEVMRKVRRARAGLVLHRNVLMESKTKDESRVTTTGMYPDQF